MIASLLHDWFAWPDGSVLTNLIASGICVGLGAWRLAKWMRRIHRSHEALHARVDELHRHVVNQKGTK